MTMPRQCLVCQHELKEGIDRDLAANTAIPALAAKYRVSGDSLLRHKQNHLPKAVARAEAAKDVARGDDLLDQVHRLKSKAISLLLKAEAAGDFRTALAGIREARNCLELLLEVEGDLNRATNINVLIASPEWLGTRSALIASLKPYPEARAAVVAELLKLEANNEPRQ